MVKSAVESGRTVFPELANAKSICISPVFPFCRQNATLAMSESYGKMVVVKIK